MEIEQRNAHSETRVLGSSHKPSVWQQFGVELGGVEDARCAALKEGKSSDFWALSESELHESMPSVSALPFSLFNMERMSLFQQLDLETRNKSEDEFQSSRVMKRTFDFRISVFFLVSDFGVRI